MSLEQLSGESALDRVRVCVCVCVCVCARVCGCVCARVLDVRGDHEREKETLLRKHELRVSRALAIKQTWPELRAQAAEAFARRKMSFAR